LYCADVIKFLKVPSSFGIPLNPHAAIIEEAMPVLQGAMPLGIKSRKDALLNCPVKAVA